MVSLFNDDCLNIMPQIEDKSIDLILCDLPYGVLNKNNDGAKWDNVIPFDKLWEQYERIIKDNGAIVLFASGMFTADLMTSNRDLWRYNLIWKKGDRTSGFLNANRMPLRNHEDICVFYKNLPKYNPQMEKVGWHKRNHGKGDLSKFTSNNCYGDMVQVPTVMSDEKYPKSVINIQPEHEDFYHPTQKPVELMKWLINTYTDKDDLVLDNCMGSGSTGVACRILKRNFIGIEADAKYFKIAQDRINDGYSDINVRTKLEDVVDKKKQAKLF